MFEIDKILGKKKKKTGVMDIDKILPKPAGFEMPNPKQKVVVHNHYHFETPNVNMPVLKEPPKKQFRLTTLDGTDPFADQDKDTYPDYMDPAPTNPRIPKNRRMW